MPQAVTVYRWDDPGAPQIGSANLWAGFLNILKKCLVEGYGAKAAAGWTVEYEDGPGNKCVFRNDPVEGSGGYVQFQRQDNFLIWCKSATSMTGIDSFVNDGYMNAIQFTGTQMNNCKWIIQATTAGFYFSAFPAAVSIYDNNNIGFTFFVGDFISSIKNDPSTFIICATGGRSKTTGVTAQGLGQQSMPVCWANLNNAYLTSINATALFMLIPLKGDGSPSSLEYQLYQPINSGNTARREGPYLGPAPMIRLLILLASIAEQIDPNEPNIRGFLPGIICTPVPYYYLSDYPQLQPLNGSEHFGISDYRGTTTINGGVRRWINCEQWEDLNRD